MVGWTHRWLVGLYGRYGLMVGMDATACMDILDCMQFMEFMDTGAAYILQLTSFLFARTCILVFEHRAHVFPCKSRFRVFFPPRSFRRPRAFSPFPLKKKKKKKKKKRKIRFIRSLANRIFQPWPREFLRIF